MVFGTKKVNRKLLDAMLGFAAGVMIAASFWSLLAPAIELSEGGALPVWVPPVIGFLAGGVFPLSALLGGALAQHFGIPAVLLLAGLTGITAWLWVRRSGLRGWRR